jgi:hypothetical protein
MTVPARRLRGAVIPALLVAIFVVGAASPAFAACPGSNDTKSEDTDNGQLIIDGISGWYSAGMVKDSDNNSTCQDVNISWVSGSDWYAGQYWYPVISEWVTGSAGKKFLSSGTQSPWWVPISNLSDGSSFRVWSDDFDRIVTTKT